MRTLNEQAIHESDSEIASNDSRNEFFQDLRISWNGPHYQRLLEESFRAYVVTDEFCEKDPEDRVEEVYILYQMKDILKRLGRVIRKEVSHG